jgi:hypothetical protein
MQTLRSGLARIRTLVLTQRSLRYLLRATWTGLAGYLIGWGLAMRWGIFPDVRMWTLFGFVLAGPSLVALFRPLRLRKLAWGLDRRLGLREQVTTAWGAATDPDQANNPLVPALLEDAAGLLPGSQKRILRRGWYLGRDLEALLIVAVLLLTIQMFGAVNSLFALPETQPLPLPPLNQPLTAQDVFPSGIPGLAVQPGNHGEEAVGSGAGPGELTPGEISALDNILTQLGEALSNQPETAGLGEALQQGDLERAALAVEQLADEVDLLPDEARSNARQAFQQAAQQAREAGQDALAEDLERTASSFDNLDPNTTLAADALDELANELRDLGERFAAMAQGGEDSSGSTAAADSAQVGSSEGSSGAGSGAGTNSTVLEPLTRLEGESGVCEFEGGENPSGLLAPGGSSGEPLLSPGGAPSVIGAAESGDSGIIDSLLTPYHFPWRWRDVVSEYFSPEN